MKVNTINTNIIDNINTKICVISDIHFYLDYDIKIFNMIIDNINMNKPDYICIPGDLVDEAGLEDSKVEPFYNFLHTLGLKYKVVVTMGNHDISIKSKRKDNSVFFNHLKNMKEIHFLDNEIYIDNNIRFIGCHNNLDAANREYGYNKEVIDDMNKLLTGIDTKYYNVLVAHNPLYLSKKEVYSHITNWSNLNLIVSGHTHGGLVNSNIKGNRGIITPSKHPFKNNIRGHFIKDGVHFVISNGIIKLSHTAGIFHRFNYMFPIDIDYINVSKK